MLEKTEEEVGTLEDFLGEVLPEEVGGEVVLDDPAKVDYQIQKIGRLRQKQDQVKELVQKQMRQLQDYLEARLRTLESRIEWYSQPLEIYIRDIYRKSEGKTKSLDLPHGKLKLIKARDSYQYDDEAILSWGDKNPGKSESFVEVKRVVNKPALIKFMKESAEIPLGVKVDPPGEPKFHIEHKEG